jgi:hypothetical protein
LAATADCGTSGGKGDGGTAGAADGQAGGSAGAAGGGVGGSGGTQAGGNGGGTAGAAGASAGGQTGTGGACGYCAGVTAHCLMSEVANGAVCPGTKEPCCDEAGGQWSCWDCIAETCHWAPSCVPLGDCNPPCAAGSFCLGTGTEGGAILMPNDAGVCPAGSYNPGGAINACIRQLSYACVPIPPACNGTITCGCAPSPCGEGGRVCQETSANEVTCVLQVP